MKKIIKLTEQDLARIVRRVINEEEDMGQGEAQGCTTLKVCKGKTFKANSLDRLSELYRFMFNVSGNVKHMFKQVNYGIDNVYPPARAPLNSPYKPGTYVAWEYVNPVDKTYRVRVSQMNECIISCPQIMVEYSRGGSDGGRYSILDDVDFQKLKTSIKTLHSKAKAADQYEY
jgi:hypothetical protein